MCFWCHIQKITVKANVRMISFMLCIGIPIASRHFFYSLTQVELVFIYVVIEEPKLFKVHVFIPKHCSLSIFLTHKPCWRFNSWPFTQFHNILHLFLIHHFIVFIIKTKNPIPWIKTHSTRKVQIHSWKWKLCDLSPPVPTFIIDS